MPCLALLYPAEQPLRLMLCSRRSRQEEAHVNSQRRSRKNILENSIERH
jgi:hypothetical protein